MFTRSTLNCQGEQTKVLVTTHTYMVEARTEVETDYFW